MVTGGRVDRGRTVGLSWVARGGEVTNPGGGADAAEAAERPVLKPGGVDF